MISAWRMGCLGLVLVGCSHQAGDGQTSKMQGSGLLCRSDFDCTMGWHPGMNECGSLERCVDGVCGMPPALTGEVSNTLTGSLRWTSKTPDHPEGVERELHLEVVDEPFETARGMMCRKEMRPDFGLWFTMPTTKRQSFWMKNTLIPLDMVFISEEMQVVGVVEHAPPLSLESRGVAEPSRYVLELPAGEATHLGLVFGQMVTYQPPKASAR